MVTPWLANNPRAAKALKFGRDQQFVVNPNGIPELCEDLKQCPRHAADAAPCAAGAGRTAGPGRDPRQGREPALRLRRLQGAGRRSRRLQRPLQRGRRCLSFQHELRRRHERQAQGGHQPVRVLDRELGQPRPLGRRRRQAVRQPLCDLPAQVHLGREGSRDPRARRRGDPHRRRLRHRRRRVQAPLAGERLDDHLRHLVGGLRFGAAQRHARLLRAGARGDRAMAGGTDARLRAGRRRRAGRRGDRLSVGGAAASADLRRRRAGKRRLLVPEQPSRQAGAGQRQCRHGDGRARLPRDLAGDLAGGRRGDGLVHDHRGGPGHAGAPAARPSAGRRSRDRLGPVGLRRPGRPDARLHRRGGLQGIETRPPLAAFC